MSNKPWRVPNSLPKTRESNSVQKGYGRPADKGGNSSITRAIKRFLVIFMSLSALLVFILFLLPGDSPEIGRFIKPVLWLSFLLSLSFFWRRIWHIHSLRHLVIWCGIIGIAMISYQFVKSDINKDRRINTASVSKQIPVATTGQKLVIKRSPDGHFWVNSRINDTNIRMLVDTGATNIVLSPKDARKLGYAKSDLNFNSSAQTANGVVKFAVVRLNEIQIGGLKYKNFPATINDAPMHGSLLGLSFLNQFSKFEIKGNLLVLYS